MWKYGLVLVVLIQASLVMGQATQGKVWVVQDPPISAMIPEVVTQYSSSPTTTVTIGTSTVFYRVIVTNSTVVAFDIPALASNQRRNWETEFMKTSTNWVLALPSTNWTTYLTTQSTVTTAPSQTVYTAWRSLATSNLVGNVWLVK